MVFSMVSRRVLTRFLLALILVVPCASARATWYSESIADGSDIVMMDLRWPWWPSGTYYANWNSGFNPKPNNISFYAGFVSSVPDGPGALPNADERLQNAFRPGSVWTFWGGNRDGSPVRFTDVAPNLFIKNDYGGEGSSGTMGAVAWPFVTQHQWYTMVARVWQPVGAGDFAYVGRWIKDIASGRWHLIGVARLPIRATSFTGNSGFIEPLSGETVVRSLHRRLGYCRKDGHWLQANTIAIDKTEYVVVNTVPEGDHEYVGIEYAQRPDLMPQRLTGKPLKGDLKYQFTVKQPEGPRLDRPGVSGVKMVRFGHQVAVSWEIPEGSSPSFGYKVEVFNNRECHGLPVSVTVQRDPSARNALLDADTATPTIRLTTTDIFDQSTRPVVVTPTILKPAAPTSIVRATTPGLSYSLYHKDSSRKVAYFNSPLLDPGEEHHWLKLDELIAGKLVREGISRGFDTDVREQRSAGYGFVFRGLLRAPRAGLYLMHAQIDGGYRIRLDGQDLLVWDGQHGTTEKTALRLLSAGDHALTVSYLYDDLPAKNFRIEWEGPGLARQPISIDALRTPLSLPVPRVAIASASKHDGSALLTVHVDPRGHHIDRTDLYLGALQLAESHGLDATYFGPMPRGSNRIWARVLFDGNHTVDSDPSNLVITGPAVGGGWKDRNVGDAKAEAGLWQTGERSFQFFGNGIHTVTQRIEGDFTATCRVDSYNGAHGEPVNPMAWVGLTAQQNGDRINWDWGPDFYLVQTATQGLRSSADFTDFGATRISSCVIHPHRPWLRIVRTGQVWTAWTSEDGTHWELGAYQSKRTARQMDVGLFISALPQDARAHYTASISQLTIQPGNLPECVPPLPTTASGTGGDRLAGVVVSRSNPQVIVVRSSAFGLLRTEDGGGSWRRVTTGLHGADLSVRSVAIHPTDPQTMLMACGHGGESDLYRTNDGGRSWNRLDFQGDFDGVGPSALCGEVVAFDLKDPEVLYAGCESKGFFKSVDAGTTWTSMGLVGERITSVIVWPWERYYPAPAHGKTQICVTTCPDRWMAYLGRGEVSTHTPVTVARSYQSPDGVKTLTVSDERSDTGFFNVAFDKAMQSTNEMRYATAHGYQTQVFSGTHMALYPAQKSVEWLRPVTAIGAAAQGEQKFGRTILQALDPSVPGRLSRSEMWAFEWSWVPIHGDVPRGGMISICADVNLGQIWWFVYTDGLYLSTDGGTTLKRVLGPKG